MVLAASGVEHEELVSIAEPLLSDLQNVPRPDEPKSIYVGGDFRHHGESKVRTSIYTSYLHFLVSHSFHLSPSNIVIYWLRYVSRAGYTCCSCF